MLQTDASAKVAAALAAQVTSAVSPGVKPVGSSAANDVPTVAELGRELAEMRQQQKEMKSAMDRVGPNDGFCYLWPLPRVTASGAASHGDDGHQRRMASKLHHALPGKCACHQKSVRCWNEIPINIMKAQWRSMP